jgi:Fe-S-cluster containining protein
MIDQYEQVCTAWEEEFARNRALHGERIHCHAGCSDCCHQLFQITEVEAAEVSAGVKLLGEELKNRLMSKARAYLIERAAIRVEPEAWGNPPPPGARLACPALEEGKCTIYEHRPLSCRKFGIPLWNPARPGRVYACELNFRDGEEIRDGHLIQIQTGLYERWKTLQADYNAAGGNREELPITVARAILEDFSDPI